MTTSDFLKSDTARSGATTAADAVFCDVCLIHSDEAFLDMQRFRHRCRHEDQEGMRSVLFRYVSFSLFDARNLS